MSCLLFDFAIEPLAAAFRSSSLKGFPVPGSAERLVAKLFADDTTVFLSEEDDYATVEDITAVWCRGSRAKFNLPKTEVIPVGTEAYRNGVLATRRLSPVGSRVQDGIHIVRDGEAIRLLGAWIGNRADPQLSWRPIVDTIKANLTKWALRRPTLHGKKLVAGMELGARTQFRAKAQGMPAAVVAELNKAMRAFIWGEGKAPKVALTSLQMDVGNGGLRLIDLDARNEAVDMMWLKQYLHLAPSLRGHAIDSRTTSPE
ncbi:hypothetical protein C8Q73DRAFT_742405 [Cubamyces lactineus]|nr:hypothetical protein C8Q73DRAFT_742405 [Cubamyces lactineus]